VVNVRFQAEKRFAGNDSGRFMRYIALLIGLLVLAACESSSESSALGRITKERAIAIAMEAKWQYPLFSKVTRATWRAQGYPNGYYAIDLKDDNEEFGKFYLVDGHGHIVGQGRIADDRYYPAGQTR
jgi:hypothetical protein